MALNFTPITSNNTIKDLTQQVNNIGSELTKDRNVFDITNDLVTSINKSQRVKLTTDKGLAKEVNATNLKNFTEPGYYYINARTLASMVDKPEIESIDVILHVLPVNDSTKVIQQLYTLSTRDTQIQTLYRYVNSNSSSEWQTLRGLSNNRNVSINSGDAFEITVPGVYYVSYMTNLPSGVQYGFLEVASDSNDNRTLKLTDLDTGRKYTNTKKSLGYYGTWKKEFDIKDIQKYVLNTVDDTMSFNLLVRTSDNITFQDAIKKYVLTSGQTTFSFYIQGGVAGSPLPNSCRGIYLSNVKDASYGVYFAIGTDGRSATGSVSNSTWSQPKTPPAYNLLWKGAKNFLDIDTKTTMYDSINNYNYVEIYTKYRPGENTHGSDSTGTLCHKFYLDGSDTYVCSGTYVSGEKSGSKVPVTEFYRVGLSFNDNKFTILDSASQNTKTQYVTRIVGINMP